MVSPYCIKTGTSHIVRILATILLLCCFSSAEERFWQVTAQGGVQAAIPLPFRIHLENETKTVSGKFRSEPLSPPIYWDIRIERWINGRSYELELIHYKLYLNDPPEYIRIFNISHGYNLFFINRSRLLKSPFLLRLGAGVVIPHPENEIYGNIMKDDGIFGSGYFIGGPALQTAVSSVWAPIKWVPLSLELKFIPALCWVPVSGGYAFVPTISFHLNGGIGLRLMR